MNQGSDPSVPVGRWWCHSHDVAEPPVVAAAVVLAASTTDEDVEAISEELDSGGLLRADATEELVTSVTGMNIDAFDDGIKGAEAVTAGAVPVPVR